MGSLRPKWIEERGLQFLMDGNHLTSQRSRVQHRPFILYRWLECIMDTGLTLLNKLTVWHDLSVALKKQKLADRTIA